jgi:acyl CoA:acetate/3-ketoacid CoA transferase
MLAAEIKRRKKTDLMQNDRSSVISDGTIVANGGVGDRITPKNLSKKLRSQYEANKFRLTSQT